MNLLEIEKELAGENAKAAMMRYDGMLAELDSRIASALAEGLPPDEYTNTEQLKKLYSVYYKDELQFHCFVSLLVSLIFAALSVYFQNGAAEPVENVFASVCKNVNIIIQNWEKGIKK